MDKQPSSISTVSDPDSVIFGLIIGGALAAPIAAKLVGKLPMKTMFLSVAALVIIWSIRIILKSVL